ncbi:MAG: site-2 protease family protein [Nitrospirae bacterium]|nr:site-2 protease family protein [Nitrospirota bacterium]MBI3352248.1 site-2 protease family protein [Nitrospirota bacterium]
MKNYPEPEPLPRSFPQDPSPGGFVQDRPVPKSKKGFLWSLLSLLGFLLLKGKAVLAFLKFGKVALTAVSMITSIWVYALFWGWYFALGFVVLIFIHEMGHAAAMRIKGIRAGAPVFIPFFGAMIALKDQPQNAKTEAYIAFGGPLAGAIASGICFYFFQMTQNHLFLALAYTGFFMNLFNLIPMSPLDGGRIVTAISIKLWGIGLIAILLLFLKTHNVLLLLVLLMGGLRFWQVYKEKENLSSGYYQVSSSYRWKMSLAYFGLIAYLGYMSIDSLNLLNQIMVR